MHIFGQITSQKLGCALDSIANLKKHRWTNTEGDGEDDVPWSKADDDGESGNESDTDVDEFFNHESSAED
jgi:hypothetical protein